MYAIAKARVALNKLVLPLIPFPKPLEFAGEGAGMQLIDEIIRSNASSVMLVTDPFLLQSGLCEPYLRKLNNEGISVEIFSEVEPDPSFELVIKGIDQLRASGADALLAIGGGSTIDTAKAMALAFANNRHPAKLGGVWLYALPRRKGLPLYVVPTTAGTGSEATIVSVLSDVKARTKITIIDPKLTPTAVALDPAITFGLPGPMTAATGMDALTHAIEAYISTSNFKDTDKMALEAVSLIADALTRAYATGDDADARLKMLKASNIAGRAFTRAGVGYVHAIAHQLGALYHLPHGLANAIVLPYILDYSLPNCSKRLENLAEAAGLQRDADAFIEWVRGLNDAMGIPSKVSALKQEDFELIISHAFKEAHGTYGVPRYMTREDARSVLQRLLA